MASELDRILELLQKGDLDQALSCLDQYPEAEGVLRHHAETESDNAARAFHLGLYLLHGDRHGEALDVLRQARSRPHRLAEVEVGIRSGIAQCQDALGDHGAAARTYRELLRDHPDAHDLWRALARSEHRQGAPAAAAQAMREYLKVEPEAASAWASLGDFQDDAGMLEDAEASWQRALEMDPEDLSIHYNRAVSAFRRKDADRLRECVAAMSSSDPDTPLALAVVSMLQEVEGDIWRGWESMRRSVERVEDRDLALVLAHRALLYAERNELTQHAADLIDQMHTRSLLDEDVHEVINRIEGRASSSARDFSVQVDARPDPAWCAPEHRAPDGRPTARYVRQLRVLAETVEEAERIAVAFEQRCGATDVRVEIEEEDTLQEADHLGVWWSQQTLHFYPG